eukprot:Nk52_evm10s281 gene=Nk52_evmTU10s281
MSAEDSEHKVECTVKTKPVKKTPRKEQVEHTGLKHEDNAICAKEAQASLNCMDRNGYRREYCTAFFEAYKDCKKEWNRARAEERAKQRRQRYGLE